MSLTRRDDRRGRQQAVIYCNVVFHVAVFIYMYRSALRMNAEFDLISFHTIATQVSPSLLYSWPRHLYLQRDTQAAGLWLFLLKRYRHTNATSQSEERTV